MPSDNRLNGSIVQLVRLDALEILTNIVHKLVNIYRFARHIVWCPV